MRKSALTGLAAAVWLTATPASVNATAEATPTVRIAQTSPLVVKGERFRPVERVVIRVSAGDRTLSRTQRTSRRGTFVARFASVTADRCSGGLSVVVTASGGRVAKTKRPDFLCPPGVP